MNSVEINAINNNDQINQNSIWLFLFRLFIFYLNSLTNCLTKILVFTLNIDLKISNFWLSFMIDCFTYLIPSVLLLTILAEYLIQSLIVLALINLILIILLIKKKNFNLNRIEYFLNNYESSRGNESWSKYINLSLNSARGSLLILTSIAILAVDFNIFPPYQAKSIYYGFSLMDIGVGDFILCHSGRLIRNSADLELITNSDNLSLAKNIYKKTFMTTKKSSLMVILGILRFTMIKLTNYSYSVDEYGHHWNFFFTIFCVKLIACPFEVLFKKSSIKYFLFSLTIGGLYQFALMDKNFLYYMLRSGIERVTFIDFNKEGIYSLFGYISIYFAGDAICIHLNRIINQK